MATLKQRIKKKNSSGTYDTLHIETNSNLVLMDNGNSLQYEMYNHTHTKNQITNFPTSMTPTYHTHPKSQISDFPSTMPPSWHQHYASDILNLPSAGLQVKTGSYAGTNGNRTINIGVSAKLCIVYRLPDNENLPILAQFITPIASVGFSLRNNYTTAYLYSEIKLSGNNIIASSAINNSDYSYTYVAYY